MIRFRLEPGANRRIDEIVDYTRQRWSDEQAATYVEGLFAEFAAIAARKVPWQSIPVRFGVNGFQRRYRSHVIYWREHGQGIAIVSILHRQMLVHERLREDWLERDR